MTLPVAFIRVKMSSGGCGTLRIETYVHVLPVRLVARPLRKKDRSTVGNKSKGMIVANFRPFCR